MHPLRKLREAGPATPEQYAGLLAEDVVFHSPMFVKAVAGKKLVALIFAASASAREGRYIGEYKLDAHTTFMRWQGTIDGHEIESLEVIVDNDAGLIVERTVAFRPYPALKLFRDKALAHAGLATLIPKEYLDYPENIAKESGAKT